MSSALYLMPAEGTKGHSHLQRHLILGIKMVVRCHYILAYAKGQSSQRDICT